MNEKLVVFSLILMVWLSLDPFPVLLEGVHVFVVLRLEPDVGENPQVGGEIADAGCLFKAGVLLRREGYHCGVSLEVLV